MATGISHTKWQGKTQATGTAGCIELYYEDKTPEAAVMLTPPGQYSALYAQSDSNLLFYGDNIRVLAFLAQDADIRGKVRLIYIDPPYYYNRTCELEKNEVE